MSELLHEPLWPTHVFHRQNPVHESIEPSLTRLALELSGQGKGGIASGIAPGSKEGLFESTFDLFEGPVGAMAVLKRFCLETVTEVVETVDAARVGQPGWTALDLVESWVHVTGPGGYHDHHLHAFRDWCGIYYVRTGGEGSGVNRFYQPFMSMDGNRGHYDVTPEPGWLVVFPGHLAHAALPHAGKEPRIVVSFNARLTSGKAGPPDEGGHDHVWGS